MKTSKTKLLALSLTALFVGAMVVMLAKTASAGPISSGISTRFSVYQGVLSIVPNTLGVLELGNPWTGTPGAPGIDIASNQVIYIRPQSSDLELRNNFAQFYYHATLLGASLALPGELCLGPGGQCRSTWPAPGGTVGPGTVNTIAKFGTTTTSVQNSQISDDGALVSIGQPAATIGHWQAREWGLSHYYNTTETHPRAQFGRDLLGSGLPGWVFKSGTTGTLAADGGAIGQPAPDSLALYTSDGTNLVERVRVNGSGNVGIGTPTPDQKLHVYGSVNPRILVDTVSTEAPEFNLRRGSAEYNLYLNGNNDLVFWSGSNRVTFTDNGNVGIGTITPDTKLHVVGGAVCAEGSDTNCATPGPAPIAGDVRGTRLCIGADCRGTWPTGTITGSGTQNYVPKFNAAGTGIVDSAIFDSGTGVGIGTISPGQPLHISSNIAGAASGLLVENRSTSAAAYLRPATFRKYHNVDTNYSEWFYELSAGNNNPDFQFWRVLRNSGGTAQNFLNPLTFKFDGTTYFNAGNVGIGTTEPSQKLDVIGSVRVTPTLTGSDVMTLGNAGRDISSTGPVFVQPESGAVGGSPAQNYLAQFFNNTDTLLGVSGKTSLSIPGSICLGGSCRITWPAGGSSQNLDQVLTIGKTTLQGASFGTTNAPLAKLVVNVNDGANGLGPVDCQPGVGFLPCVGNDGDGLAVYANNWTSAIYAEQQNLGSLAGHFLGNVLVEGDLQVTGACNGCSPWVRWVNDIRLVSPITQRVDIGDNANTGYQKLSVWGRTFGSTNDFFDGISVGHRDAGGLLKLGYLDELDKLSDVEHKTQLEAQIVRGAGTGGGDGEGSLHIASRGNAQSGISLYTSPGASGLVERMKITGTGNVGIGTASPGQKFDVAGGNIRSDTGFCIGGSCITSWPAGGPASNLQTVMGTGPNAGTTTIPMGIGLAAPVAGKLVINNNLDGALLGTVTGATGNGISTYANTIAGVNGGSAIYAEQQNVGGYAGYFSGNVRIDAGAITAANFTVANGQGSFTRGLASGYVLTINNTTLGGYAAKFTGAIEVDIPGSAQSSGLSVVKGDNFAGGNLSLPLSWSPGIIGHIGPAYNAVGVMGTVNPRSDLSLTKSYGVYGGPPTSGVDNDCGPGKCYGVYGQGFFSDQSTSKSYAVYGESGGISAGFSNEKQHYAGYFAGPLYQRGNAVANNLAKPVLSVARPSSGSCITACTDSGLSCVFAFIPHLGSVNASMDSCENTTSPRLCVCASESAVGDLSSF